MRALLDHCEQHGTYVVNEAGVCPQCKELREVYDAYLAWRAECEEQDRIEFISGIITAILFSVVTLVCVVWLWWTS